MNEIDTKTITALIEKLQVSSDAKKHAIEFISKIICDVIPEVFSIDGDVHLWWGDDSGEVSAVFDEKNEAHFFQPLCSCNQWRDAYERNGKVPKDFQERLLSNGGTLMNGMEKFRETAKNEYLAMMNKY